MIGTKQTPILPQNAETIIIVLGQCCLPTGEPHPWLIDRVNTAYDIITKNKLNIATTYFIVSGSDVSNRQFNIPHKNRHPSQASLMHKFLNQIHEDVVKNKPEQLSEAQKQVKFSEHVLIQDQANTTIENFYHAFKIIRYSKAVNKIKSIYVVTSDFHMKRGKLCFDNMFFSKKSQEQVVSTRQQFNYDKQVFFVPSNTKWRNDYDKNQKYEKQQGLYHENWLISEMNKTADRLWTQFHENPQ